MFLVLNLFYRRPMVYFKENKYIIFQGSRGVQHFFRGVGHPTFFQGGGGGGGGGGGIAYSIKKPI